MDISIFLAKVIGLYLLIMGLVLLKKPDLQEMVNELSKNSALRLIAGVFTLILGLLLVVSHNVWSGGAYVIIITIIAWVVFIKGLLYVWLSDESYSKLVSKINPKSWVTISGVVNLILGFYLSYVGFFV